jgi:hypothetical protein
MLSPDDRWMLTEVLEPPAGFRLDAAAVVTYSLDLDALLTIPAAFAFTGDVTTEDLLATVTPLELLNALRTQATKITVCCDAGGIDLPSDTRSGVFAFLERSVVPVRAPRGGVFHPKMWALRFSDDGGDLSHRIIVTSRNLTFDRSWDTVVCLEEDESGVTLPRASDLLDTLARPGLAVNDVSEQNRTRLESLSGTIRKVRFGIPQGFDSMTLHVLGLSSTRSTPSPMPKRARVGLVVSPFLTHSALAQLPPEWDEMTVVSRPDELDRALAEFATNDDGPQVRELNPSAVDVEQDPETSLSGLHAKIFVFDEPRSRSHVFTGSANATHAAFNRNVEILLELSGSTRHVGVARWLAPDDALGQLLIRHTWEPPVEETDVQAVQHLLEQLRAEIAQIPIEGVVKTSSNDRFEIEYRANMPLPDLRGAKLSVRPISIKTWTPVSNRSLSATFSLGVLGLTAFLGVRLELQGEETQFAVVATMSGVPEDRESHVLSALLADPARLVRFLLMLLFDSADDRFNGHAQQALERSKHLAREALSTVPLMEVMARALTRQPARLIEIDRLLQDLGSGSALIDENLTALWESVRSAGGLGSELP